ncbi:hypothetical protein BHC46_06445 [Snodgrassella alvi]|jgi:hypothetical protein|uniref:Uncharacterized protein n=1 Tax=Snodgrassella alvi TaxID=1196083 RepID=A0A2N9XHV2_9NEIS|nr:hypothetical protein BGI35_05205 [Snodgrassella communis]PIT47907.1 hypothetical protein BHC46_06445 [Snodgrassella alvi]
MMPAGLITASCLNINPHIFKINKGEKQCIYKLDGFYFDRKRKGWLDFFRQMDKVYLPPRLSAILRWLFMHLQSF